MKELYYVVDEVNVLDYFIIKKENDKRIKYILKRSNGEQWNESAKNESLFTVIDNYFGECKIKTHGKDFNDLAYHELIELGILLDFVNNDSALPSKYEFIKKELK